jgi:phage recombination protein Bet
MNTAVAPRQSLVVTFAQRYGVDSDKLLDTLKATAFKQRQNSPPITNEQMMSLLIVANEYKLNPFTKEIFAFPDKQNGIVPVVSVDGWIRIINEHPQFDGEDFEDAPADEWIVSETAEHKPCPSWMACVLYRKDRSRPTRVKEYLDEVYRPPYRGQNGVVVGPWQTHTKRMMRHKCLIQSARVAFGFAGIYDEDEAMRILEAQDVTPINVTAGTSRTSTAKDAARKALGIQGTTSAVVNAAEQPQDATPPAEDEIPIDPKRTDPTAYTVESAIKLMSTAANRKGIDAFWGMIVDDFDFREQPVPPDIEDYYKAQREKLADTPPKKTR